MSRPTFLAYEACGIRSDWAILRRRSCGDFRIKSESRALHDKER